jgi:tetratricopeptide (TPR) repeat protein
VALSLNNLAALYESQGRYTEAEPLYLEALDLHKRLLGDNHPHVATSLNNLADIVRFPRQVHRSGTSLSTSIRFDKTTLQRQSSRCGTFPQQFSSDCTNPKAGTQKRNLSILEAFRFV